MKSHVVIIGSLTFFLLAGIAPAKDEKPKIQKLDIRIEGRNAQAVLYSAAGTMWKYFPGRTMPPIIVKKKGGPITLFKRGPNGEIRVKLATGGTLWSQHAFQFAHEFGHILCNYDSDKHPNKWFEESICEVASLFALRRMAEEWREKPPYPNWKSYAKSLKKYADNRMLKLTKKRKAPFKRWFRKAFPNLRNKTGKRTQQGIVALRLLPLFEKEPDHWESVTWLNTAKPPKNQGFKAYLSDWKMNAPKKHRAFIKKVGKAFGVILN